MEHIFKVFQIAEKTWAIQDRKMANGVNAFLLEGNNCSLLIDSGYGFHDISSVCRSLTDKRIVCVCTHGHIDHAMGARYFSECYLHSADMDVYRNNEIRAGLDHYSIKPIDNNKEFDLGGRVVTWRLFPGHTPGSIVFLDSLTHYLFDGDAQQPNLWLFMEESCDIVKYRSLLLENIEWMNSVGVKGRFCGHTDPSSPLSPDMSELVACLDKIISTPDDYSEHSLMLGNFAVPVKLYTYGNTSINYRF